MRRQRQRAQRLLGQRCEIGGLQRGCIGRHMGFAPAPVQPRHIGQVGQFGGRREARQEWAEVFAVQHQPHVMRRVGTHVFGGGGAKPVIAHQPRHGGVVGVQCVDATFDDRVAVYGKTGLTCQWPVVAAVTQRVHERMLKSVQRGAHASAHSAARIAS